MNILHVDTARQWRGGQRQLQLLVQGLRERGHHQELVSPIARHGLKTWPVWRLMMAARGRDIVAAHTSHAHQLCVLAGLRPLVHRRVDFPVSGGWKYRRARGYICVSEAVRGVLNQSNALVVPDGVAPLKPSPPADLGPGRIVLAVGALVDHKDHATLARAARGLDARVVVAGEGALRYPELEHLGQRDDIAALHARANVFVHSSKLEGMGQAVIEALQAGLPVVATAAGGVPEVVGEAGLLVPVGDSDALRAALQAALAGNHPASSVSIQRGQTFSVQRMVEGTERAYLSFAP
jgi:L-malate glycosyltransferase